MTTAPPHVGWVRITSSDPPLRVTARLSEERPNVESGYGGWASVDRPRKRPLTTWTAAPPVVLSLPILLDRFRQEGPGVEGAIDTLTKMGWPTASDGEPPQLRITSRGRAIPHQDLVWVLTDLSWGDALMNGEGNRVRQAVTLTLQQFVQDTYLAARSAANRRRAKAQAKKKHKPGASQKRKVVKKKKPSPRKKSTYAVPVAEFNGEDLLSIAARELGDADRWLEIAQLNGIRDPRSLVEGQVIRLP